MAANAEIAARVPVYSCGSWGAPFRCRGISILVHDGKSRPPVKKAKHQNITPKKPERRVERKIKSPYRSTGFGAITGKRVGVGQHLPDRGAMHSMLRCSRSDESRPISPSILFCR